MDLILWGVAAILIWCCWNAFASGRSRQGWRHSVERGDFGPFTVSASAEWSSCALLVDTSRRKVALINAGSAYRSDHLPPHEVKRFRQRQFACSFDDISEIHRPGADNHGMFRFVFKPDTQNGMVFGDAYVTLYAADVNPILDQMRVAGLMASITSRQITVPTA